jgi:hypothetical protein
MGRVASEKEAHEKEILKAEEEEENRKFQGTPVIRSSFAS